MNVHVHFLTYRENKDAVDESTELDLNPETIEPDQLIVENSADVTNFDFLCSDNVWSSVVQTDQAFGEGLTTAAKRCKVEKSSEHNEQNSNHGLNLNSLTECTKCDGVFLNRTFLEKHVGKCLVISDSENDDGDEQDVVEDLEDLGETTIIDSDWDNETDDSEEDEDQPTTSCNSRKRKLNPTSRGMLELKLTIWCKTLSYSIIVGSKTWCRNNKKLFILQTLISTK